MAAGPTQEQVRYYTRKTAHRLHAEALKLGCLPEWQGCSKKPTRDFWFYLPKAGGVRIAVFPTLLRASNVEACLRWDAILTDPAGRREVTPIVSDLWSAVSRLCAGDSRPYLGAHSASPT